MHRENLYLEALMATLATVATVISAGASLLGAIQQRRAGREERENRERANEVQNRQASIRRQRAIRQRLAAARVQQAEIVASGFAAGAPGASGVAGARSGISTDVAANVAASNVQFGLEQQRVGFLNQAGAARSSGIQAGAFSAGIQGIAQPFTSTQSNVALSETFGF